MIGGTCTTCTAFGRFFVRRPRLKISRYVPGPPLSQITSESVIEGSSGAKSQNISLPVRSPLSMGNNPAYISPSNRPKAGSTSSKPRTRRSEASGSDRYERFLLMQHGRLLQGGVAAIREPATSSKPSKTQIVPSYSASE